MKFSPPKASLRDRFRPNAAIRSVRAYERIAPIRSPRPVLAMSGASGLLVTEFIEGDFVERIWESEPHSMDKLVEFLAEMHERRVFHGDFRAAPGVVSPLPGDVVALMAAAREAQPATT